MTDFQYGVVAGACWVIAAQLAYQVLKRIILYRASHQDGGGR